MTRVENLSQMNNSVNTFNKFNVKIFYFNNFRMIALKCESISREFVCAYVKDRGLSREQLNLQSRDGKTFMIRDLSIIRELKAAYSDFLNSFDSISQFFGRTIALATTTTRSRRSLQSSGRENEETFKVTFPRYIQRPILLFKCGKSFYLNDWISKVRIQEPVRMNLSDLFGLYKIHDEFDIEDFQELEERENIKIHFYRLKEISIGSGGRTQQQLRGVKSPDIPGPSRPNKNARHTINIGLFSL